MPPSYAAWRAGRPDLEAEVRAPLGSRRLETLPTLNRRGIETYAFVWPLLPRFRYHRDGLDTLFAGLTRAGVRSMYVEHRRAR